MNGKTYLPRSISFMVMTSGSSSREFPLVFSSFLLLPSLRFAAWGPAEEYLGWISAILSEPPHLLPMNSSSSF